MSTDQENYHYGRLQCQACKHEWVGVWPHEADPFKLECQNCGKLESLPLIDTTLRPRWQVAALDATGKSSIWHVQAVDEEDARAQVALALEKEPPYTKPVVVLCVIPGGKKS